MSSCGRYSRSRNSLSDKPLVMHHKYRFWIQPFEESYHQALTLGETTGSALLISSQEFDVPKCSEDIRVAVTPMRRDGYTRFVAQSVLEPLRH